MNVESKSKSAQVSSDGKFLVPSPLSSVSKSLSSVPVEDLRRLAATELLQTARETNHFYQATITNYAVVDNSYAGTVATLNQISVGTGWNQRLGDSCRLRRLRFRFHYRPMQSAQVADPSTGTPQYTNYSGCLRLAIVLDKMPIIGTIAPVDQFTYGGGGSSNPPSSASALWAAPATVFAVSNRVNAGDVPILVRNPQTFGRFHVMREVILMPSAHPNVSTINPVSTVQTVYNGNSSIHEFDIDLHDMLCTWYDQANAGAFLDCKIVMVAIADTPNDAIAPGMTGFLKWQSDLEFVNLS